MKQLQNNSSSLSKIALFSFLLGLSVITTACSDSGKSDDDQASAEQTENAEENKDAKDKKEKPPVPVEVVAVQRGDIQQTYRTITTLEAEQDAQVVARSTGILQTIFVEEGDTVKKGQMLAQLDVEMLQLEVAQLQATTKKLMKELDRQQTLFNRKLGSSDALDRARFEYESQQAQLQVSKLKLQYASIKAPIDGVITERMVKTGNLIRESDILFKIVDPLSLKAVLHLPEKELNRVQKGQSVLLAVDALNDQMIVGQVERIRPAIDTDTGTFKVIAKLDNTENQLKSGMFGKVEVVFDVHSDSLLLKQQALITQDNRNHVFVVRENKAMQTPVKVGFRHNGIVEIIEGLEENDQVITTGQQILKHESVVEVVGSDEEIAEKKPTQPVSNVAANP